MNSGFSFHFAPRAVALAVVALGLLSGCRSSAATPAAATVPAGELWLEPQSPKLAYISVDTVRERHEKVVATLPAQLVMNEDHTVRVQSPLTGRIRTVDARPGDAVQPGSPLAHIGSADLAQGWSDQRKADAALAQTTAALGRVRDLYEHHVAALRELQQAQADESQARAESERAHTRMALLGIRRDNMSAGHVGDEFVLRSPIRGEIIDRTANPGAEVRSDNGQILFTISALDTLWLVANLFQRDLPKVRRGDRVQFVSEAIPGTVLSATVTFVSEQLDPQTHTATVRAALPNPGRVLKAQLFGEMRVFGTDSSKAGVVPSQALVTRGAESVVFVEIAPGHFARRAVTIGDDDGELATVLSGLAIGDRVVTRGSLLLAAEADRGR